MNKLINAILDILILIAACACIASLINMAGAIRYAHRQSEDPVEKNESQLAYKVRHRAYGEVMSTYYAERLDNLEPQPGMENLYHVAAYAHAAFMSRVYEEKQDQQAARENAQKRENLRSALGDYAFTADEVDEMLQKAP